MKTTTRRFLALTAIAGSVTAYAAPFLAMGDSAELFLTGSGAVRFDDNIFLDTNNEQTDTILSFTPGFDLVFGKGSATQGNFYYREEILAYSDHDDQNTSLSSIGLNTQYDGGKSKFDFGASYAQVAQNDNDIRATGFIVRRQVSNLRALSEFGLTQKTSLGIGVTYDSTDYGPNSFTDNRSWRVPADVYFEYTEKLALSVGYRYRNSSLSGSAIDNQDHFINIGARGEFTPKLTGQLRVGYSKREFDRGSSENLFGVEASLAYAYSDKTGLQFNISNDFGNAGTGDSTKNFTLGLAANTKFTEQWALNANLDYRSVDYPTRNDDYLEGQIALNYTYNVFLSFSASLTLRDNSSTSRIAEFANNVLSLGASVRY